jgi:hypothetical protein
MFTPIFLANVVRRTALKLSVYLAVHTSKVWQIFVGETEQCRRMTTDAFALCKCLGAMVKLGAVLLVKLNSAEVLFGPTEVGKY